MPKNVQIFAWLWCASILIGIAEIFVLPAPPASALKMGITSEVQTIFAIVLMVILLAILLPFFWLAVWRRKNWARWVLLLLFLAFLPLVFVDHDWFNPDHLLLRIVETFGTLIEGAGFVYLFTGDANAWYRQDI